MQNIVTWGQNMSANIGEFARISMGGLFIGVPLYAHHGTKHQIFICAAHFYPYWYVVENKFN